MIGGGGIERGERFGNGLFDSPVIKSDLKNTVILGCMWQKS